MEAVSKVKTLEDAFYGAKWVTDAAKLLRLDSYGVSSTAIETAYPEVGEGSRVGGKHPRNGELLS